MKSAVSKEQINLLFFYRYSYRN